MIKEELIKKIETLKSIYVTNDFQEGYNSAIVDVIELMQETDFPDCEDCTTLLVNPITQKLEKELEKYKHLPDTLFNRHKIQELVNSYNMIDFIENGPYSIVRQINFNEDGTFTLTATKNKQYDKNR